MDNFLFDRPEWQLLHKLRTVNPDLYFQLLKTHLSYCIDDIPPESLATNYFVSRHEPRKSKRMKIGVSGRHAGSGVIGAPLTQEGICRAHQLIEFIGRKENISKRDLFRRPGNAGRQENLKFKINSGVPLDMDKEEISVYDCCEVLKRFLAELKDPLVPAEIFEVFCLIPGMESKGITRSQKLQIHPKQLCGARVLLLLLPTESLLLLYNILTLLTNILEHKEDNLTNIASLSVLFTPSVLLARKLSASEMARVLPVATQVMAFLIENMPSLFDPPAALLQDTEMHIKKLNEKPSGELVIPLRIAFCQPVETSDLEDYTETQLKKLQTDMNAMPNCSQKKLFYKKLKEQKNELTPNPLHNSSPSQSNRTDPIRKYFAKSFKRKTLFSRNANSDRLSTSMSELKTGSPVLIKTTRSNHLNSFTHT